MTRSRIEAMAGPRIEAMVGPRIEAMAMIHLKYSIAWARSSGFGLT